MGFSAEKGTIIAIINDGSHDLVAITNEYKRKTTQKIDQERLLLIIKELTEKDKLLEDWQRKILLSILN